MRKKIFIAIYTICIVLVVVFIDFLVTTVKQTPIAKPSQAELADTSVAQFNERANGNPLDPIPGSSNPLYPVLYPGSEKPVEGCSLRFSLVPDKKAVDPGASIHYSITVSNAGSAVCKNVSLSMYYTGSEQFVSSDPIPTSSDYYWNVGDLGSRATYRISLSTRNSAKAGDQILSEGCVTGDNSSDVCAQTVIFIQTGASSSPTLAERIAKIDILSIFGAIWGKLFAKHEFAIWVWDSPVKMTPAYAGEVLRVAKQNGFNAIYVTIDDYLPILQLRDSAEASKQTESYMQAVHTFVSAAKASGMSVDAVGGAKDWAEPNNRWKGYALIDFVKRYNEKYPDAKLRNLQYDVEPYLLSDYDANKAAILTQFVEFVDESASQMTSVDAGLSIVIPHFYDKEQKWTPPISYKGQDGYTFTQLLKVLAQKDNTTMIIMAYRNFFNDKDGTKDISEPELEETTAGNYKTKIIIAQETGDVPPDYVTFHNYPKSSLLDALNLIQSYFGKYKNFNGVAVHYFDSFLKLN
jgi:hypothetical protein